MFFIVTFHSQIKARLESIKNMNILWETEEIIFKSLKLQKEAFSIKYRL